MIIPELLLKTPPYFKIISGETYELIDCDIDKSYLQKKARYYHFLGFNYRIIRHRDRWCLYVTKYPVRREW